MSDKFNPLTSYYRHQTGSVCGICGELLTHPAILIPAGPAYVKQDSDNVQSEVPLLEYPTIKVCHEHALVLLAELSYDPNNPDEGKWWREWQEGNLEPVGLSEDTPSIETEIEEE